MDGIMAIVASGLATAKQLQAANWITRAEFSEHGVNLGFNIFRCTTEFLDGSFGQAFQFLATISIKV